MKSLNLYYRGDRLNVVTPIATAALITFVLFFIDEGHYSLLWMRDPWNFYPFAVYVAGFALGQLIVASFLYKTLNGLAGTVAVFLLGLPAGIVMSFVLICTIGILSLIFGWT